MTYQESYVSRACSIRLHRDVHYLTFSWCVIVFTMGCHGYGTPWRSMGHLGVPWHCPGTAMALPWPFMAMPWHVMTVHGCSWVFTKTGATVGGLPPFSLQRLEHSGEWLCTSLKIGLENISLTHRNKQPHGGAFPETKHS
ncbi:unnamed protein product [Laminaria digitata]